MKLSHLAVGCVLAVLLALPQLATSQQQQGQPPAQQQQANPPAQAAQVNQNVQQGAAAPAKVADAEPFTTKDGKRKGWKIVIPGNRPLATPAVVDGKVFIGGGFGSHEFYAFDAATGKKVWQYQTKDDGPTAAVVDDGHIGFNTESCELEILSLDGKPVWKKWLGDPLMSMPAISQGKVYMAYPDSKGDKQHYVACFELKTGKEFWKKPIAGEIITAPVVAGEHVYLATLEGTLFCFGKHDGELLWKEKKNATSSPVVLGTECYFSRREEITIKQAGKDVKQQREQVANRGTAKVSEVRDYPATQRDADYLDYAKKASSPTEAGKQSADAGVGFGGGKGDAKIAQATTNLGEGSVVGVWAYQGSKPFMYKGRLYSCMGDRVQCVDPKTEKVIWSHVVERPGKKKDEKEPVKKPLLDSILTPPALANDRVFVGTTFGDVVCLSAQTGEVIWTAGIGEPIIFQPAIAKGRVYVSTNTGHLYAVETGDAKDDGWLMWGGSAAHNGLPK